MDKLRLLAKIAEMYYEEGFSQLEIAKALNIPRSTISKLLTSAKEAGYVRIVLNFPNQELIHLERKIEKSYNLKECVVVEKEEDIGSIGAKYVERILNEEDVVGISWGLTLEKIVRFIQPSKKKVKEVVQIVGGLGDPSEDYHAINLTRELARKMNSQASILQAPGIVRSLEVKKVLLSEPSIANCLKKISSITVALVGIGTLHEDSTLVKKGKILTEEERKYLISKGCIGDVALIFLNKYGEPVITEISERIIGISYEQLKRIKNVIAFAGGIRKLEAIRAALRSGLLTALVTDKEVAKELVKE